MRTRRCDECSSTSTFSAAQCFLHERPQSSCHADACSVREPAMRHTVYGNICCAYVRALQRPRQNDVLKNGLYKMRLSPPRRQGNEARALQSTACMRSLARCRCAAITHHAAAERARKRDAARRCSSQHCSTGHVGASLTPWHAFYTPSVALEEATSMSQDARGGEEQQSARECVARAWFATFAKGCLVVLMTIALGRAAPCDCR